MNKWIFVIVILLGSFLFAQVPDPIATNNYAGRKGLLFDFNNISLNTFRGGIGMKYWSSNQTAYTGKIILSVAKDKKEESGNLMGEESSEVLIGVDFGYENHIAFLNKISPYFGVTIGAGFEKIYNTLNLSESTYFFMFPSSYNNETETSLISITLLFDFGIEFFLHKNISLAGQYSIGGVYKFGEEKIVSNIVEDSRNITELNAGISSSSLILSIYF